MARTPDGHPDLSGIWQAVNTAAWDLEPHIAQRDVPAGIGDATHVTERITRIDDETMECLATVEDTKMYTRPWTMRYTMKRNTEPGWEQWEHACHEGERSLERLLVRPDGGR